MNNVEQLGHILLKNGGRDVKKKKDPLAGVNCSCEMNNILEINIYFSVVFVR